MASRDVVLEAKSVLDSLSERIESRVLRRSTELKPRIVSLAGRMSELTGYVSSILGGLASIIEEGKRTKLYRLGEWFYTVFEDNGFVMVRSKPYVITLSYRRGDGRIYVRTRNFEAGFSPSQLALKHLAMKVEVDPGSPKDIEEKQAELKYLLRKLGRIIEFQLLPVAEKRLPLSG